MLDFHTSADLATVLISMTGSFLYGQSTGRSQAIEAPQDDTSVEIQKTTQDLHEALQSSLEQLERIERDHPNIVKKEA